MHETVQNKQLDTRQRTRACRCKLQYDSGILSFSTGCGTKHGEAETSEALNAGMLASTIHNFSKQEQTATETQQVLQAKDICTLKQQLIPFEQRE